MKPDSRHSTSSSAPIGFFIGVGLVLAAVVAGLGAIVQSSTVHARPTYMAETAAPNCDFCHVGPPGNKQFSADGSAWYGMQVKSGRLPPRTTQNSSGFAKINDSCEGKGGNRWKLRLGGRADMEVWMTLDANASFSLGVPQGTTFSFACGNAEPPPPPSNQFLGLH